MSDFSILGGHTNKVETSTLGATTNGINLDPNASAHTKGAWFELVASTSFDWSHILLSLTDRSTTVSIIDIGVGSSGNEEVLLQDILIDFAGDSGRRDGQQVLLPIGIPEGTRISGRSQVGQGAGFGPGTYIQGISGSLSESSPLTRTTAEGINLGTTRGTAIDPGATQQKI